MTLEAYAIEPVLSAAGALTTLGASPVRPEVLDAVREISGAFVEISSLQDRVTAGIAKILGAEAAYVVNCCAAGVAVAVAACLAGHSRGAVEELPDTTRLKRTKVVLQKGHCVNFGANLAQHIRLTGARLVEVGAATECHAEQLRYALDEDIACGVFVVSHHAVQSGLVALPEFASACHERGIPVVVDAAAEPDPRTYLAAGADCVVFSAHKRFRALTAGVIAGKAELIAACRLQEYGLGRLVKAGKENIFGAAVALEIWARDGYDSAAVLDVKNSAALVALDGLPDVTAALARDGVSPSFSRVRLSFAAEHRLAAAKLCRVLRALKPPIFLREGEADIGVVEFDFRLLDIETTREIAEKVAATIRSLGGGIGSAERIPASDEGQLLNDIR